ncbi:hypothetical protein KIW84_060138 [Lathyrus oleraceus]|uniref:Uncharacterized protein n=1 Tax=Pisum sativum TaxID=3888 RepID=A0A9D5A0J6_PEA|nr:hypothetical protein KIW84_060138 [Pisum sativum]
MLYYDAIIICIGGVLELILAHALLEGKKNRAWIKRRRGKPERTLWLIPVADSRLTVVPAAFPGGQSNVMTPKILIVSDIIEKFPQGWILQDVVKFEKIEARTIRDVIQDIDGSVRIRMNRSQSYRYHQSSSIGSTSSVRHSVDSTIRVNLAGVNFALTIPQPLYSRGPLEEEIENPFTVKMYLDANVRISTKWKTSRKEIIESVHPPLEAIRITPSKENIKIEASPFKSIANPVDQRKDINNLHSQIPNTLHYVPTIRYDRKPYSST